MNWLKKNTEKSKAMQKGRRLAYLKRCLLVQNLTQEHENETTVRKMVFEYYIKPVLKCSYSTFNNMLNVKNPQREMDLLTINN